MKAVVEQEFFHEFAFDNKVLKSNFKSGENVRTLWNSNSNFVTSLVEKIVDGVYLPLIRYPRCGIQIRTSSHL